VHTNFPAAYLPNGTFSQHNPRINVQPSLVSSLVLQKSLKSVIFSEFIFHLLITQLLFMKNHLFLFQIHFVGRLRDQWSLNTTIWRRALLLN